MPKLTRPAVTESNIKFVWEQIQNLKTDAEKWNYDVNLDFTYDEIQDLIASEGGSAVGMFPQEKEGPIERYLPDFDLELPNFSELLP